MMNKNGFSRCGENYINRLHREGRYSTAHVYKRMPFYSFSKFCGTLNVSFEQVTKEHVYDVVVESCLYECGFEA